MLPEVGMRRVSSMFIVVVFPAPFGPRSPNISPSFISRVENGKAKKYYSLTIRGENVMKSAAKLHKETLKEMSKLFE